MRLLLIQQAGKNSLQEYSNFIKQAVITMLNKYNEEQKVNHVILNKLSYKQSENENNLVFTIEKKTISKLLQRWWYNVQLPAFVKKEKINIVIHDGETVSKNIKIPQYVLLQNIFNSEKETKFKIANVKAFIVYNQFAKDFLIQHYKINEALIKPINPFTENCHSPLGWEEREKIKDQFSAGSEYFLVKGVKTKERFIHVLKGFSKFKKWQQSKMNILMLIHDEAIMQACEAALSGYKYADAVKLLHETKENQETLLKAAYAFIHDSNNSNNFFPVYNAFKNSVAVIAPYAKYMDAFTNKPVLQYAFDDFNGLSQALINIYKDEQLRNRLINEGCKEYQKNVMPDAYEKLWQILLESL